MIQRVKICPFRINLAQFQMAKRFLLTIWTTISHILRIRLAPVAKVRRGLPVQLAQQGPQARLVRLVLVVLLAPQARLARLELKVLRAPQALLDPLALLAPQVRLVRQALRVRRDRPDQLALRARRDHPERAVLPARQGPLERLVHLVQLGRQEPVLRAPLVKLVVVFNTKALLLLRVACRRVVIRRVMHILLLQQIIFGFGMAPLGLMAEL